MFRVVIAEDDPMVAMINEQYVNKNKDFRVVQKCSDGKSAVEYLKKNAADLLILDLYMPVMDGIEALTEIRKADISISVIMVTAANDISTFESIMHLGVEDYLVKPFSFDRFQQALDRFASRANALQGSRTLNQNSIDSILGNVPEKLSSAPPKGIQDKTKSVILECLASSGEWMDGEDIAYETGLSSVTVRRYMNYLVETGDVTGKMNYDTGGRPSMLYRLED